MSKAAAKPASEAKFLSKPAHRAQFLQPMQLAAPKRFAPAGEGEAAKPLAGGEVALLARTKEPVTIWGEKFVHDFDSIVMPGLTPTDYCHDRNQILGKADRWSVDKEGLKAIASLLSTSTGDRAEEILLRLEAGTPYQSSIEFEGELVYYYEGDVVVNGQTYSAPIYVWRNWTVLAVAICPLGRDGMTRAELIPQELSVKPGDTEPPKPAATPSGDKLAVTHEEIKRFHERFGSQASDYLAKALSYDQAVDAHAIELAKQLAAVTAERDDLATKLAAATAKPKTGLLNRGEAQPISGGTPGEAGKRFNADPLAALYSDPLFQPKSSRN